jgi:16S rRNA (guanine966-N2)-methyltransferase
MKETLFGTLEGGVLTPWPVPFLDLFAGSGAAGIEALSRGSPSVIFVERDPAAVRTIRENLRRARLLPEPGRQSGEVRVEIVQADALRFLAGEPATGGFGVALVDPPYGDAAMLPALERLGRSASSWLGEGAVVVAKHFWRDRLPGQIGRLEHERERRFGETMLTFYRAMGRQ